MNTATQTEIVANLAAEFNLTIQEQSDVLYGGYNWARLHWEHARYMQRTLAEQGLHSQAAHWSARASEGETATEKAYNEYLAFFRKHKL